MDAISFYQTIPQLGIKGRIDTPSEFDLIGLPKDLDGKSVCDIGCNIGGYLLECYNRNADELIGTEPNDGWRWLAFGILFENTHNPMLYKDHKTLLKDELQFDLVLLLSVTHVSEGVTGQQLIDDAYYLTKSGGLLIIEINDRLQVDKLTLPREAKLYGKAKDNRSVYHVTKSNLRA